MSETTPPLFDRLAARDPDDCDVIIFLGSPSRGESADWEDPEDVVSGVRRGCDRAGAEADKPWLIAVRDGDAAPSREPAGIRNYVRREIVDKADAAIFVLTNPSFGCGREMTWAISVGVPVLLLVPPGHENRVHVGATSWESRVWVAPVIDGAAASSAVMEWITGQRAIIQSGPWRRSRQTTESEVLRLSAAAAWNASRSEERDRLSRATHTTREHLVSLLSNENEFASARASLVLDLAHQLGVWRQAEAGQESATITEPMWDGLDAAVQTWEWDGQTVARTVRDAIEELESERSTLATGAKQRNLNLTSRYGWREVRRRHPHES